VRLSEERLRDMARQVGATATVWEDAAMARELLELRVFRDAVLAHRQACEEESGPVAADDTDEQMHARIEKLNRLDAEEDAAIAAERARMEGAK
jgi:hypothetical protein